MPIPGTPEPLVGDVSEGVLVVKGILSSLVLSSGSFFAISKVAKVVSLSTPGPPLTNVLLAVGGIGSAA
jgi:hypothetical protein